MKIRATIVACLLVCASVAAPVGTPAVAQDLEVYLERQKDLATLAFIFGEMHHIRRTCDPRYEGDVWRERMKQLINLEEPQERVREDLVAKFNTGYRGAQRRYPSCDRRARDDAAARATQGDQIVRSLMDTLERDQEAEIERSPLLISPVETID